MGVSVVLWAAGVGLVAGLGGLWLIRPLMVPAFVVPPKTWRRKMAGLILLSYANCLGALVVLIVHALPSYAGFAVAIAILSLSVLFVTPLVIRLLRWILMLSGILSYAGGHEKVDAADLFAAITVLIYYLVRKGEDFVVVCVVHANDVCCLKMRDKEWWFAIANHKLSALMESLAQIYMHKENVSAHPAVATIKWSQSGRELQCTVERGLQTDS